MAVKKQRKQAEQRALQIQVKPEQVGLLTGGGNDDGGSGGCGGGGGGDGGFGGGLGEAESAVDPSEAGAGETFH